MPWWKRIDFGDTKFLTPSVAVVLAIVGFVLYRHYTKQPPPTPPSTSPSLEMLANEVRQAGFDLWYPAEEGILPGDIWRTETTGKSLIQHIPPGSIKFETHAASFITSQSYVAEIASYNASAGPATKDKAAADLTEALKAASITELQLDFGSPQLIRFPIGDLSGVDPTRLSPAYFKWYQSCRERSEDGLIVVAAVIQTKNMRYVAHFTDRAKLSQNLTALNSLLGASVDLEHVSEQKVQWTVGSGSPLVIGVERLSGRSLPALAPPMNPAPALVSAQITFRTMDDDKDNDTAVYAEVRLPDGTGVATFSDSGKRYDDHSVAGPFDFKIINAIHVEQLRGCTLLLRIAPNGHDTWRFQPVLALKFSDGTARQADLPALQLSNGSAQTVLTPTWH